MAKRRRHSWPSKRFLKTGPKLRASDLRSCSVQLTDGLSDFLLWQNGGVPDLDTFVFDGPFGKHTIGRVRSFDGINIDGNEGFSDIARTILGYWHDLPRGCVPIGEIDIAGLDFEVCTLVTFLAGERAERVYFFDNPHDVGPLDPDDPKRLTLLAKTLPAFVKSLRCHEEFLFREVFQLKCGREGLLAIETALVRAGVEQFGGNAIASRKAQVNRYAFWPSQGVQVYLAYGTTEISWVPIPSGLPPEPCYLGINVTKWNRAKVLAKLKSTLRSIPEWRGAKSVGKTPAGTAPYWRK